MGNSASNYQEVQEAILNASSSILIEKKSFSVHPSSLIYCIQQWDNLGEMVHKGEDQGTEKCKHVAEKRKQLEQIAAILLKKSPSLAHPSYSSNDASVGICPLVFAATAGSASIVKLLLLDEHLPTSKADRQLRLKRAFRAAAENNRVPVLDAIHDKMDKDDLREFLHETMMSLCFKDDTPSHSTKYIARHMVSKFNAPSFALDALKECEESLHFSESNSTMDSCEPHVCFTVEECSLFQQNAAYIDVLEMDISST